MLCDINQHLNTSGGALGRRLLLLVDRIGAGAGQTDTEHQSSARYRSGAWLLLRGWERWVHACGRPCGRWCTRPAHLGTDRRVYAHCRIGYTCRISNRRIRENSTTTLTLWEYSPLSFYYANRPFHWMACLSFKCLRFKVLTVPIVGFTNCF